MPHSFTLLPHATQRNGGTTPPSEKAGYRDDVTEGFVKSERYRLTGEGNPKRCFVAEIEDAHTEDGLRRRTDERGRYWLTVGLIDVWENFMEDYLTENTDSKRHIDKAHDHGLFSFIHFLLSDLRAGSWAKGAGAVLIDHAEQFAAEKGLKTLHLDCWVGGTLKLVESATHTSRMPSKADAVRYYERLGFTKVIDYSLSPESSGRDLERKAFQDGRVN